MNGNSKEETGNQSLNLTTREFRNNFHTWKDKILSGEVKEITIYDRKIPILSVSAYDFLDREK